MINYKHLHYFWAVAKEGGVARAGEKLNLTPQTISGQIGLLEEQLGVKLFNRVGRNLELTEDGRLALGYADEIFSLGGELEKIIQQFPGSRPTVFRVGVADVVPKSIARKILAPALLLPEPVRLVCREASLDQLLAELSIHHLDLVLADSPVPANVHTRAYNHKLGECPVSFFATRKLADLLEGPFPQNLDGAPMLLPSVGNQLRSGIDLWLDKHRIRPRLVAEFDDSALMKAFGHEGAGIFTAPAAMEAEVEEQYQVVSIGQIDELVERFFAISVERRVQHPVVAAVVDTARTELFANDRNPQDPGQAMGE